MSNVVEMSSLSVTNPISTHHSLRLLSRALALLFIVFAALQILWVLAACIGTLFFSSHMLEGPAGTDIFTGKPPVIPGMVLYSSLSAVTRGVGMIAVAAVAAPFLMMFWELHGLFGLYARGIVFARENAVRLKRVGLWLILYPFAKFAAHMSFRLAGGLDRVWFHMEIIYALVAGLIVLAVAQVMEFGREIELDRSEII